MTHGKAGKGDRFRPVNRKKYAENYDRIFGEKSTEIVENLPPSSEIIENLSKYSMPEFQKFPKIPRLYRDIIITEKIDGTNAQVFVLDSGEVLAGSRNRFLSPDQPDNYGFRAWVEEHTEELQQLGPGRHFGEWWGQGINRDYGLNEKRFSLFNVSRWLTEENCEFINLTEKSGLPPNCCHVVPVLYVGPWELDVILAWGEEPRAVQDVLYQLQANGSKAAPGFMQPEGIVIYHTHGNCCFKVTLENDEKPKGEKRG